MTLSFNDSFTREGGVKNFISVCLAGKIQKVHENSNETYWTEEDLPMKDLAINCQDLQRKIRRLQAKAS